MIQLFQEADLPKLSQTSLYEKFNQSSGITKAVVEEIQGGKEYRVKPEDIPEILSLIRLNGDSIVKKAVDVPAYLHAKDYPPLCTSGRTADPSGRCTALRSGVQNGTAVN